MRVKCSCGGYFSKIEGLDGYFCEKCNAHIDEIPEDPDMPTTMSELYSEDNLRTLRGVPHTTYTCGSETKGRVCIQVPANASRAQTDKIIQERLESLKYMLELAKDLNLNIFTNKG